MARSRPPYGLPTRRGTLLHKAGFVLRHPERVPTHLRRAARDAWLRARHRDHVSYYRAVMASDAARSPEGAVGGHDGEEVWLRIGRMQFDYLRAHGLTPQDRMLDIGCGNLRAGWRFIEYLEPGNYYGVDISPDILVAAKRTLVRYGLQDRLPHLAVTGDLTFDFLPAGHFTVVQAHSVFSHSPPQVIEECFAHVGRVLAPGGRFDFTFDRTTGREHHVLREDFYYRTETLAALAERHGLAAEFMSDWEQLPHRQSKMRLTHATPAGAEAGEEGAEHR